MAIDSDTLEKGLFGVACFAITSARGLLDEPLRYAPLRLLDTISQMVDCLEAQGVASERLKTIRDEIEDGKLLSMASDEEWQKFLEDLTVSLVEKMD